MMRRVLVVLFGFVAIASWSQSDFDRWRAQQEEEFRRFLSEEDAAFAQFLEDEWRAFRAFRGESLLAEPEFEEAPVAAYSSGIGDAKRRGRPVTIPRPEPVVEPVEPPQPPTTRPEGNRMTFYGATVSVPASSVDAVIRSPSADSFRSYWTAASRADIDPVVDALQEASDSLRLNDWGYFTLVLEYASREESRSIQAVSLAWVILLRSGYDVRIAYASGGQTALMLPVQGMLYGTPYFSMSGKTFFLIQADGTPAAPVGYYTYQENHPSAAASIDMNLSEAPAFPRARRTRDLRFSYDGERHEVSLPYNGNTVAFYENYPQTDIPVHFTESVDSDLRDSVVQQLGQLVRNRTEVDAANLLLRFVQTAFDYEVDDVQFGREKWLFPEESLHYAYSDCEDRSILYAYLVRRLLGLPVVVLEYPGHIATAVHFADTVRGDSITIDGDRYVICDPTYINADVGQSMPSLRDAGISYTILD